jgi:hypothetical protein
MADDSERVAPLTSHERICLKLMDFGFTFPAFADVMPGLAERGLAEDRGNGRWHVTGTGRRAHQGRAEP